MVMLKEFGILSILVAFVCSAPVHKSKSLFKEAEYEVTLQHRPGETRYFINSDEIPIYEHQFEKIRELGEEVSCKIRGNCQGEKRGNISTGKISDAGKTTSANKKSIYDKEVEGIDDNSVEEQVNKIGGENDDTGMNSLGPNLSDDKRDSFMGDQKDAAHYGQQPQMDIKMSPQESAAVDAGMGSFSGPVGPPGNSGPGAISANDAMLKMQEEQNEGIIQNSVSSKMDFMDGANKGMTPELPSGLTQGMLGGSIPGMPGGGAVPGLMGPMGPTSGLGGGPEEHGPGEGKDEMGIPGLTGNGGSSVNENDIMKAEDIQPNEMQGINTFLKDSNHMEKDVEPSQISNGQSDSNDDPSELGKTNVDFGTTQASIENNEASSEQPNAGGALPESFAGITGAGPEPGLNTEPIKPGGVEVPTLNNLGLGMTSSELGPMGGPPNLKFIQDNTRQMIQQNSDYKVPQTAFTNLWNAYLTSTQSQLGEKDPSANSRESISRPQPKAAQSKEGKLHRRSNKKSRKHH